MLEKASNAECRDILKKTLLALTVSWLTLGTIATQSIGLLVYVAAWSAISLPFFYAINKEVEKHVQKTEN